MATITPLTARRKLELSQLSTTVVQQETMGIEPGWKDFVLFLSGQVRTDIEGRIIQANITRTIEGASTLSVTINDYDRELLRSGLLSSKLDVQLDGLWFRLTTVDKSGDELTLTFEDREIAILRTYNKWRIAQRGQMTRAEFVLSMIREVKEFSIPVVIPELHREQPIERYNGDKIGVDVLVQKSKGITKDVNSKSAQDAHRHGDTAPTSNPTRLTVKNALATSEQIANANIILAVGDSMGLSRELKVVAMMTAITETAIKNEPGGPNAHNIANDTAGDDSAGVFQQRPSWGSYLDRTNVETSARLFYERARTVDQTLPFWAICDAVQHPDARYAMRYAQWRVEADRWVTNYGDPGTTVDNANLMGTNIPATGVVGPYYYYRGTIIDRNGVQIRKKENTWDCIQRLGDEVDWRGFFVSGTFYFISEDDLFKQLPLATISEFDDGIDTMDGNYDGGKGSGTLTLGVRIGSWLVPPGSVVFLTDMGPFDGRWLVNDFNRDLLADDATAQITLKKPRPQLPEPAGSNSKAIKQGWIPAADTPVLPPTNEIVNKVLTNPKIHFSNNLETSDIKFGAIDDRVLQFLQWFTTTVGYDITITALKSDHSQNTTEGRISAHSVGKAVDIGTLSGTACGENAITNQAMNLIAAYQINLGFDQLIGPWPLLCLPRAFYDAPTLAQHKNHIHVGWPL